MTQIVQMLTSLGSVFPSSQQNLAPNFLGVTPTIHGSCFRCSFPPSTAPGDPPGTGCSCTSCCQPQLPQHRRCGGRRGGGCLGGAVGGRPKAEGEAEQVGQGPMPGIHTGPVEAGHRSLGQENVKENWGHVLISKAP